jgi:type II secretory pathway pseudopilin PulG
MKIILPNHIDSQLAPNSRRDFMLQSTVGLLGLTLHSASSFAAPAAVQSGSFTRLLARFAENVAFNLISSYVYDWLQPSQKPSVESEIKIYIAQNFSIGTGVFVPTSGPSVPLAPRYPSPSVQQSPYFFFPLQKRDGINGLAHFFDFSSAGNPRSRQADYWAATLAAPSILGLNQAAREIRELRLAPELRPVLLPICEGQHSQSAGSFQASYQRPDEYCTSIGKVRINYKRTNLRGGRVSVEVIRSGKVILDAEYCAEPA